jgi:hypothetical protein
MACPICNKSHEIEWQELGMPMQSPGNVAMTHYAHCPNNPGLTMLRGFIVDRRVVKVHGCARCGGEHEIEFSPFLKSPIVADGETLTHFAMCPTLNEPILMRIIPSTGEPEAAVTKGTYNPATIPCLSSKTRD